MTAYSKLTTVPVQPEAAIPAQHPSWNAYQIAGALPPVIINDPSLPLVSIVTPSYNQGAFIRETIDSVLSQDYPNLEYWVIDGGSTDDTLDILHEYDHDPRFHWLSESDKGQADAINKGWVRCRGAILGWLNSDDTYLPGAITAQVQVLRSHSDVGVVYGDAVYIDAESNHGDIYRTRAFNRRRFLHVSAIAQPSAFIRRELVETYGLLNSHLHYALDFEFFVRLMWHTRFWFHKRPIATFRQHPASKTVSAYRSAVSEAVLIAQRAYDEHADVLGNVKHKIVADWYWAGATCSLQAGRFRDVLAYSVVAIRWYPLSPRMVMVALKTCDVLFHTRISTWALAACRRLGI